MRRIHTQPIAIILGFHRFLPIVPKDHRCIGRHLLSQALPIAKHQKYSPRYFSSVLRSPCEDSPSPFLLRQGHGAVASPNPQTNTRHYRIRLATATRLRHLSAASSHCRPCPQTSIAATRLLPPLGSLAALPDFALTHPSPQPDYCHLSVASSHCPTLPSRIHRRNPTTATTRSSHRTARLCPHASIAATRLRHLSVASPHCPTLPFRSPKTPST